MAYPSPREIGRASARSPTCVTGAALVMQIGQRLLLLRRSGVLHELRSDEHDPTSSRALLGYLHVSELELGIAKTSVEPMLRFPVAWDKR